MAEVKIAYDGVLGIRAGAVYQKALALCDFIKAKDRKGFGACSQFEELRYALTMYNAEIRRRIQNSPQTVIKVRILKELHLTAVVYVGSDDTSNALGRLNKEKRKIILMPGETGTVVNFLKNRYVVQHSDISKAEYTLLFNRDGEDYEIYRHNADRV